MKSLLLKRAYPASFSLEEFKQIKTFAGRKKYCDQRLQRISSGSGRIVYIIDETKVLKLAKNPKGVAQNSVESDGFLSHYTDVLAQVFDSSPDDEWLEMELAKKISPSRFKQLMGFSLKALSYYFRYKDRLNGNGYSSKESLLLQVPPEEKELMDASEWVSSLEDVWGNMGMSAGDWGRTSTWGEVERDGKPVVVMIDYGLTHSVQEEYYKRASVSKDLKLEAKATATDDSERCIFSVPSLTWDDSVIPKRFLIQKAMSACNKIIIEKQDEPGNYFISVANPYVAGNNTHFLGFTFLWDSPQQGKFTAHFTKHNYGIIESFVSDTVRKVEKPKDGNLKVIKVA